MMKTISFGKYRGLQQCSTTRGVISVLALDHRNNLRKALNPQNPAAVSDAAMSDFNQQVTGALSPHATAVLLDPEVGAFQCLAAGTIPGSVGLVVAVEETGYTGDSTSRETTLLPDWAPEKAKRLGASAVKMLVYYHPNGPTARTIEALVQQVADACQAADIPFMLEPLSYPLIQGEKKLQGAELRRVVVETARRLTPLGVDVLKAEFPADSDETMWASACAELSSASAAPWVLLSASVSFDTYLRQVAVACEQGASGVAVGRA